VRDAISFELSEIRTSNLVKSDGTPMYNWACVVDDHRMEITDVMRGRDGISNTPRQLLLYQAMGWEPPRFSHVAFILGPDGQKLRQAPRANTGVSRFRDKGYCPRPLLITWACWAWEGKAKGTKSSAWGSWWNASVPTASSKRPASSNYGKLDFLNAHWLRAQTGAPVCAFLAGGFLRGSKRLPRAWLELSPGDLNKGNAVLLADLRAPIEAAFGASSRGRGDHSAAAAFCQAPGPAEASRDKPEPLA